jgi:hypothetical protein
VIKITILAQKSIEFLGGFLMDRLDSGKIADQ